MFINTTGTIIKTIVNTRHFTRILRINSSQISLFLYIHFGFSPDATRTQYLAHKCTRQFRLRSVSITRSLVHTPQNLSLAATKLVARQPKDSPLHYKVCCLWAQESSLSAGHSLYRRERTPSISAVRSLSRLEMAPLPYARCLAVGWFPSPSARCLPMGWLPRHPLTVSPWKDLIAIRCSLTAPPWGESLTIRSPSRREAATCRDTARV